VRAPQDYITSAIQEIVKTGVGDWAEMTGKVRLLLDYREKTTPPWVSGANPSW
jgi:hypothetical protein